ncbi:MAG: hypothetical protein ACYC3I_20435, partial [Gemmataceae bacterium]
MRDLGVGGIKSAQTGRIEDADVGRHEARGHVHLDPADELIQARHALPIGHHLRAVARQVGNGDHLLGIVLEAEPVCLPLSRANAKDL